MANRRRLKKRPKLKAIDFFCGAGGVTCGFNKAGIDVLAGIDIDPSCRETYEKNNKNSRFIQADISKYSPEQLGKDINIMRNDDRLIFVGCSPCQYYTIIHTSKEKSAKSKLLLEDFQSFIDYFRPGYIFIENVPGLETKEGSPLQAFKSWLELNGYAYDDKVVNACYYNVPQSRRRYVLVASRVTEEMKVPDERSNKKMTVRNFIAPGKGFAPIEAGHRDKTRLQHTCANLEKINLQRMKSTPLDGGTRLSWKNNKELQLACYVGKDDMFTDVYGRMYWDHPSPTITTKFFSISNGRFGHPEQHRAISLREGATLQSFPRSYKFHSTNIESIARMIGNAVPPNMAEKIGKSLVNNFSKRTKKRASSLNK